MEILLLDAQPRHIPAMEELEKQCFSQPWTADMLASQMPDERHVFLVAEGGGEVLGYVGMMHILDEGYISNVAVSPHARRQGIGDRLIDALLQRADKLELSFVTLEVRESNSPARSLYAKHGFQDVGLRKNYYDQPKENAILMTKFRK